MTIYTKRFLLFLLLPFVDGGKAYSIKNSPALPCLDNPAISLAAPKAKVKANSSAAFSPSGQVRARPWPHQHQRVSSQLIWSDACRPWRPWRAPVCSCSPSSWRTLWLGKPDDSIWVKLIIQGAFFSGYLDTSELQCLGLPERGWHGTSSPSFLSSFLVVGGDYGRLFCITFLALFWLPVLEV